MQFKKIYHKAKKMKQRQFIAIYGPSMAFSIFTNFTLSFDSLLFQESAEKKISQLKEGSIKKLLKRIINFNIVHAINGLSTVRFCCCSEV